LPLDKNERQRWINSIPSFSESSSSDFRICKKHWPSGTAMIKTRGGRHPAVPPSIFDVPKSCLPTPAPPLRSEKPEFALQNHFDKKDIFKSFSHFSPKKELVNKYKNIMFSESEEHIYCVFMDENFTGSKFVVKVTNKPTLVCPVTFSAVKNETEVPIPLGILSPNNGFYRYSQFFAAIIIIYIYMCVY
jgi:hypothetical protein